MKIAIYTCIVGKYDNPCPPLCVENNCDYYMISDDESLAADGFKWIDVDAVVPDKKMTPKEKNRYCKFHPRAIFPEYDFSIYLDGCIQIVGSVSRYINDVGACGIAVHKHRRSNCVYKEGIILIWLGAVKKDDMLKKLSRYAHEGFPREYGMFECGMIITNLNNHRSEELYNWWYEEHLKGAGRDQMDLMYVLWKYGMKITDIGVISSGTYNILSNPDICWHRTSHYK